MAQNLLVNPSFEGEYTEREKRPEVKVASGWYPFWAEELAVPEYKPLPTSVDPVRVLDGDQAQCWFIRWNLMDAGVMQYVTVPVGAQVVFSVSVQAWCSQSDDPRTSDGDLDFAIGIDPLGGDDPWAQSIEWSDTVRGTAEYKRIEVSCVAEASVITVYVRAWNKWKLSHNDAYIDAADLSYTIETDPPAPVDGTHVVEVYIDGVQIAHAVFEAEVQGIVFRAAGLAAQAQPTLWQRLGSWLTTTRR